MGEGEQEIKKPRRSDRISSLSQTTPLNHNNAQLPSPLTHQESTNTTNTESLRGGTVTPPEGRPSQIQHRTPVSSPPQLSSPPLDTQPFSQFVLPSESLSHDVIDEEQEGVWGYLIPLDSRFGDTLVLRKRTACPAPSPQADFGKGSKKRGNGKMPSKYYKEEEEIYEDIKLRKGFPAGGYLIGRHPECGTFSHPATLDLLLNILGHRSYPRPAYHFKPALSNLQ